MNPKNIIFIMADQFGAQHLNCYGSGIASTPALDALAARGAPGAGSRRFALGHSFRLFTGRMNMTSQNNVVRN
jgi:hypothetical protein